LMKPTTSAIAASAGVPDTSTPNVTTNDESTHNDGSIQNGGSTENGGSTQSSHHHGFWLWRLLGLSD